MNYFPDIMFPDVVDLTPPAPGGKDASAGRTDNPGAVVPGLACRVEEADAQEILAADALGQKLQFKVFFPDLDATRAVVSAIRLGTLLTVVSRGGRTPPRPVILYVNRLVVDELAGLVLYRAECSGRS